MHSLHIFIIFAVGLVTGWLWGERPDSLRAIPLLEVMTAFGTVGAVWVSLWQAAKLSSSKNEEDKSKFSALAQTLNEALASLSWTIDHIKSVNAGKASLSRAGVRGFIHSANVVANIPFHENPYCQCYKDVLQTVLNIKMASHVLEDGLISGVNADQIETLETYWKLGCAEFNEALLKPRFLGVVRPTFGYISPAS